MKTRIETFWRARDLNRFVRLQDLYSVGSLGLQVFEGRPGLLWEVPHQALQDGPGDVLLELGLVYGWAVDPAVASLPCPLFTLKDAGLPHGFEEVDDTGAADGVGLELGVDSVPYCFGAEAFGLAQMARRASSW